MRIFLLADIKIINDEWVPAYAEKAHEIVHKHGGRYLSGCGNITTVEGEGLDTSLIAIIEFRRCNILKFCQRSGICSLCKSAAGWQRKSVSYY